MQIWTVGGAREIELKTKSAVVNAQTVLYMCAKIHNFLQYGSMCCHRLKSEKKTKGYNRYLQTFGAWPQNICQ